MTKMLIKTKADHRKLRAMLDENTITLTLTPAAGALDAGVNGTPYGGETIAATNAVGAARFHVSAGALPTGLTLDAESGEIAGTPTETVAAKAVSITATDAFGNVGTNAYTITIAAA